MSEPGKCSNPRCQSWGCAKHDEESTSGIPTYEQNLDKLFNQAFSVNHPAMLDWAKVKLELKKLRNRSTASLNTEPTWMKPDPPKADRMAW